VSIKGGDIDGNEMKVRAKGLPLSVSIMKLIFTAFYFMITSKKKIRLNQSKMQFQNIFYKKKEC
jgi:hypothetical protein